MQRLSKGDLRLPGDRADRCGPGECVVALEQPPVDGREGLRSLRLVLPLQGVAHQRVHQQVAVGVGLKEALALAPAPIQAADPAQEGAGQGGHLGLCEVLLPPQGLVGVDHDQGAGARSDPSADPGALGQVVAEVGAEMLVRTKWRA